MLAFLQRWTCFHRDVSEEDCNFVLCSFNQDPPSAYLRVPLPKTSHHSLCCWDWVIYGKHKRHHRMSSFKVLTRTLELNSCTGQCWESHHDVCTTNHHPTRLHRAQVHKYLPQPPLGTGNLLQSITASQLTAKRVCTTWLIWHKSPMMFQASSTNWFNKSQPRKFFLDVTVKTARTFCDSAHTHGAV